MDMEVSVQGSGFGEDGMSIASVEVVAGASKVLPRISHLLLDTPFFVALIMKKSGKLPLALLSLIEEDFP